jgi:phospholipid/cholesterol/gamma-HCH transport system substrate-binding protein
VRRFARENAGNLAAVVVLAVIAVAVGGYILANQRLRFPWEPAPVLLRAELSTAQAVTPGQGQTVRVAGVRIGDIGRVELHDGRAYVTLEIDPEYDGVIRTDATALLRPKTGLKDMFLEVHPGSESAPAAREGWTMPVRSTLPDVNPDEVFSALDADTRDYLRLLVHGAGGGLRGRGDDLREVFRRFEPTHRDLARVNRLVARRERSLRRAIHALDDLNAELGRRGDELTELVDASATVFGAFAQENANVTAAVRELPGALRQTTDTLGRLETFARDLGPAADRLRPVFAALDEANEQLTPFARDAAPVVRSSIRPFARETRPLVRDLRRPARELADATPDLTRAFRVLERFFNMLGHNPDGREGPAKAVRQEGYLFWLAWLQHIGGATFATSDANGPLRPVTLGGPCSVLEMLAAEEAPFEVLLQPVLQPTGICG